MYLGIDLGTSNSVVGGIVGEEIRVFKGTDGSSEVLPSVIYIDKRGHKLFGRRAYNQAMLSPGNVAAGFKRLMGTASTIEFEKSGLSMSPEECSGEIIRQLVSRALVSSGVSEITGTAITIPAAFNQMQSEATLRAAKHAGIETAALVQEPIAAAMATIAQTKSQSGLFLIYDFGGGTFDAALVQNSAGIVNVLGHAGENQLGGRDFDKAIVDAVIIPWLEENYSLPSNWQTSPRYRHLIPVFRLSAERAKIALSSTEKEFIFASDEDIRTRDEDGEDIFIEISLARSQFEALIQDQIARTIQVCKKLLKSNGYAASDIAEIVLIGGPSQMPLIREQVPEQLGVKLELAIDPMTAVAQGAAIFAESRNWADEQRKRKSSTGSLQTPEEWGLRIDFRSRTTQEQAQLRIKLEQGKKPPGFEIEIHSMDGWTTGRLDAEADIRLNLPLNKMGKNTFRLKVYDQTGRTVEEHCQEFSITRTYASTASIPASQTIAAKVLPHATSSTPVPEAIIEKGTPLPAKGTKAFRAARALATGGHDSLSFELYQDEGAPDVHLNLQVGVFQIKGMDLEEGMAIREGDELLFHWQMNDSCILCAYLELPAQGQVFDLPKYYVPQAGHRSFGQQGRAHMSAELEEAQRELEELKEAVQHSDDDEVREVEHKLTDVQASIETSDDPEDQRKLCEELRRSRQAITRGKQRHRRLILSNQLNSMIQEFDDALRDEASSEVCEQFDKHLGYASSALNEEKEETLDDAEAHIQLAKEVFAIELFSRPEFIINYFKRLVGQAETAIDPVRHKMLTEQGLYALRQNDIDEVKRVCFEMQELLPTISAGETLRVDFMKA